MNKKEQLEFLNEELVKSIKQLLVTEVEYRTLTALEMAGNGKDTTISAMQTQAKKSKTTIEAKVRHMRAVIKDLEDGKLVV